MKAITNMKNRGFRGVIGWAALLLLFFTQVAYGQGTGDFVVSGESSNYSFDGSVLTVSGGDVTVSTAQETSQTIKLTGGRLILNNVHITVSNGNVSPIEVEGTEKVVIDLVKDSKNTLTSASKDAAGIHVPPNSQVTFTGSGTLTAENTFSKGNYICSSGIGGKQGTYSCGTIIFDLNGTVTARGGVRGAGIGMCKGAGLQDVSGNILIKKGTINAQGGMFSAGIGTGPDTGSGGGLTITIEGGSVTATGGSCGIGQGGTCKTPINIFLLGGAITADIYKVGGSANLNTIIVGPDVIITDGKTVTNEYTNGFVFSGTLNKSATVKGNPVFPADKQMTIDAGETLTVPSGTTLTNNGTIINNGIIINEGTITGKISGSGAISGIIPNGWTGKIAYKVSYNPNNGNGTVAATYHLPGIISSFPSTNNLSREGYTCLGWNSDQKATAALKNYTVTEGENTLYAVWAKNVEFTSNPMPITGTVGEAFTEVDLSTNVNKNAVSEVTFKVKGGCTLPTGFSLTEAGKLTGPNPLTTAMSNQEVIVAVTPKNGAQPADLTLTFNIAKGTSSVSLINSSYSKTYGEATVEVTTTKTGSTNSVILSYYTNDACTEGKLSSQPTDAGTYYIKAVVEEDVNYSEASATAKFVINKKRLIITPDANQFVYTNEADTYAPTYQVEAAVNDEQPAFKGKLSWESGNGDQIIREGSLKFMDNGAFKVINYDLKLSSPSVTIKVLSESLADTYTSAAENLATDVTGSATDGWHKASITLKAPTDFKLKAVTNLRDASGWEDELVISQEGKYDFKYQLLREGRDETSASDPQTLPIQLDQTIPELKGAPAINNLTATFTLADATSGIASYSYAIDGGQPIGEVVVADSPTEHKVEVTAAAGSHKITFTAKDAAGNEATIPDIAFTLNDPVTPPDDDPDPAPDNNPQPVYYNVTLPDIEGASFDRGTGNHEVEAWSAFIFHLTLAEGYKKDSHPVVTTNRGETIAPRQSDGAYVVKQIRSDINISVSGIIPDNSTGIADIDSETRVRAVGRVLHITVPQEAEAYICDMSGRLLPLQKLAPGTNRVNVYSSGIYIVKIIGEKEHKVIVQ